MRIQIALPERVYAWWLAQRRSAAIAAFAADAAGTDLDLDRELEAAATECLAGMDDEER